ncbi:MAG: AraC family transcriptional regulator, partial [Methylorubrum extorquens]
GMSVSGAVFAVSYESAPQFRRAYGRLFGLSPVQDAKATRS